MSVHFLSKIASHPPLFENEIHSELNKRHPSVYFDVCKGHKFQEVTVKSEVLQKKKTVEAISCILRHLTLEYNK